MKVLDDDQNEDAKWNSMKKCFLWVKIKYSSEFNIVVVACARACVKCFKILSEILWQ